MRTDGNQSVGIKRSVLSFLLMSVTVLAACMPIQAPPSTDGREVTFYVGPSLVDCVGVGPQKCMQVKEDPDEEYRMFYGQIEGFEYEEGYEYVLRVWEAPVENPPADGSALRWTLLEEVSKIPVGAVQAGGEEAVMLEGTPWKLESYRDAQGETVPVLAETKVTALLTEGQIGGNDGCNRYFGSYTVDGDRLEIALGGSTMMACPPPIMDQAAAVLAGLGTVATYRIDGALLTMADADGATTLTYVVDEPASLVGTNWQLLRYNNGRGGLVTDLTSELITARFDAEGKLSGFAGCNNYSAPYVVEGSQLQIGPTVVTLMACSEPEGVMETEAAYLAALATVRSFDIQSDEMTLYDEIGTTALQYRVAQ